MHLDRTLIEQLIFRQYLQVPRFTQDSPIYPGVWLDYFIKASELDKYRSDLIFTPHRNSTAGELFKQLSERLINMSSEHRKSEWKLATSGEAVVAKLTFKELVTIALPMTKWWQYYLFNENQEPNENYYWFIHLTGAILEKAANSPETTLPDLSMEQWLQKFRDRIGQFNYSVAIDRTIDRTIWSVNSNRQASLTIQYSVPATKADAGRRLFDIDGTGITWAVLDSGIDARHPAFRAKDRNTGQFCREAMGSRDQKDSNFTRVVASYDFSRFRDIISEIYQRPTTELQAFAENIVKSSSTNNDRRLDPGQITRYLQDIDRCLESGRMLDWGIIAPLLRIPHNDSEYVPPNHPHGTHVAGIIAACRSDQNALQLIGMCPGIQLYDVRVMDNDGAGEEFNILAACQFIRWINSQKDSLTIHGVNMSFSMQHDVASYACGQTPVCLAAERLVLEGTVVVAAAGNLGQAIFTNVKGDTEQGFRIVNITDPGNAAKVITVGATHRDQPHTYGVSYFSSKGPTGDGRIKPDLVAPGEKILSAIPDGGQERMDGTSMAAPHVSGAAALVLAKHRELIGQPERVKHILCKTATDLGRERHFQGAGMLDVLRAIQSV